MMPEVLGIIIAFGAGVLSFFSPCILPLIPAYICFITGLSSEELNSSFDGNIVKRRLILTEAVLFILGFSIVFVALGTFASFLGKGVGAYKGLIRVIGGIIVILFGLHIIGLFKIKFLQYEKRIHLKNKPVNWIGSLLVGMAFGFGWTPCVGPILGGILIIAATGDTLLKGAMLLLFYSLGLALPFLLVSIGIKWVLSLFTKVKRYFKVVSVISGILLIIIGITILLPQGWTQAVGTAQEEPRKPAPDFTLPTLDGQTLRLSDFKGKIIILNFWAMDCFYCRKLIAEFVGLQNKYKDKDLVIIGVSLDRGSAERIKSFYEDAQINYLVVRADDKVTQSYDGIMYLPTSFIIDREMNIVEKLVGYSPIEVFESKVKKEIASSASR